MKKYAAALAAALLALLGLTALAPSAQAYPNPAYYLKANVSTVVAGHTFFITGIATVNCDSQSIMWDGQTGNGTGAKFKHKYRAPLVTATVVITAHGTCTYTAASGASGNSIAVTTQTLTASADITVIPVNSKGNGKLPNTGGPSIGWLIGGIAALLAGAGAMFASRRRDAGVSPL